MRELLYIIGPPGVGKTTALRSALEGVPVFATTDPFPLQVYGSGLSGGTFRGVQLGCERKGFAGTDTLGMAVQPSVEKWLDETAITRVVAEGDRLANEKFFHACLRTGWDLTVMYFTAPWDLCAARRADRAVRLGSTKLQDEQWLKGRHTKCENLALTWCRREHWLDGCASQHWMCEALKAHSVIRGLRGEA